MSAATLRTAASAWASSGRAAAIRAASGARRSRRSTPGAPRRRPSRRGRRGTRDCCPGPAIASPSAAAARCAPVGGGPPLLRGRLNAAGSARANADERLPAHARRFPSLVRHAASARTASLPPSSPSGRRGLHLHVRQRVVDQRQRSSALSEESRKSASGAERVHLDLRVGVDGGAGEQLGDGAAARGPRCRLAAW